MGGKEVKDGYLRVTTAAGLSHCLAVPTENDTVQLSAHALAAVGVALVFP